MSTQKTTTKKTAYHHGNLKQTLVEAAFVALETTSWENLSLRKLAKEAGVTPTAAYNHFADKVELLLEVKTEAFRRFHTHLNKATADQNLDAEQHIITLGRAYFAYNLSQPTVYNLLFGWTPPQDRITGNLIESAGACEILIEEAIANYLKSKNIEFDHYSQTIASFFSWSLAHGVSTLISGGNVQAAAVCNNFPPEFMFEDEDQSRKILADLFNMMVAGITHGMPCK